ncbi:MAG: hypothetical protein AAGE52_12325 [Myxococcota bacterium]
MKIRRSLLAVLTLSCIACGDDSSVIDAGGDSDAGVEGPAFVVGSRIRTPSGRTFYVSVEPDLNAREIDLSRSLELNGFARSYAFDGAVFVMDSESLEVTRYRVTNDLLLEEEGRLSMAGLGFTTFRVLFVFLSPERAYYIDTQQQQVVRWNPREMVLDGTVPLEGIDRGEQFEFQITGLQRVEDRIFLPIAWTDERALELVRSVAVVVLDAATGETEGVFEDERCVAAGGSFATSNGDLYVIGDNDDGRFSVLGDDDLPPPCLLRVRAGADDFDPDYYVDLRELTGAPEVGHLVGLPDGTAATRVLSGDLDLSMVDDPFELTFAEVWDWVLFDVEDLTVRSLGIPLSALPFPPFEVNGTIVLPQESVGRSTLYRVEDGAAIEGLSVAGEFLQLGRVR